MARSMVSTLGLLTLLFAHAGGCTVESDDGDTNPFGTSAAGTAGSEGTSPGSGPTTAGEGEGSATGPSSTTTSTSGTPGDTSSTGSPPETSDGPPGDSSGSPGDGQLGECIGTGAWTSCAMYCEANLDVCVQGGCGGATVVYYKNATDCEAEQVDSTEATPCNEPFAGGGGISFARCCCA